MKLRAAVQVAAVAVVPGSEMTYASASMPAFVCLRAVEVGCKLLVAALQIPTMSFRDARYGLRAVRIGEASHPGPPNSKCLSCQQI